MSANVGPMSDQCQPMSANVRPMSANVAMSPMSDQCRTMSAIVNHCHCRYVTRYAGTLHTPPPRFAYYR